MKISFVQPQKAKGIAILVLHPGSKKLSVEQKRELALLDDKIGFSLEGEIKRRSCKREEGEIAVVAVPGKSPLTNIIVGFSAFEPTAERELIEKLAARAQALALEESTKHIFIFSSLFRESKESAACIFVEAALLARYAFTEFQSETSKKPALEFQFDSSVSLKGARLERAASIVAGVSLARDLVNTPPSNCPPRQLVARAKKISGKHAVTSKAFSVPQLKAKKMNGILSVGRASKEPPAFITLKYQPKRKVKKGTPVIGLVGKGVTFDSGGLSIKTGAGMETMKCDMAGAAAVLGTIHAASLLQLPVVVHGYIPTAENMIDGNALKPGDVIPMMSGKTVEVLNTDAEGRLILADALHYASNDGCDVLIDLATLTGSCVVALGEQYAGLFTDDDELAERMTAAGTSVGEYCWRMPLAKEYKSQLKSKVADIKNIGSRWGGSITAALFLQHFVSNVKWAHLDIAGPAFMDSSSGIVPAGGTGFGVRLLLKYLESLAQ